MNSYVWRSSAQLEGWDRTERSTAVCEGGLFSLEVESRLRGLQLRVWGGGCVYEKINSEKGRETMCLKRGGGVYMRKSIVRWRKRDYMSQQRGGGGG